MISAGTVAALVTLAQTDYSDSAERSLVKALPMLLVALLLTGAAMMAFRSLLSRRREQGFEPLRLAAPSTVPGVARSVVVSHRPGGASAQRLARSLEAQDDWTVRMNSRSTAAGVSTSAQAMLVVVDGSWPVSSVGRMREPARRHLEAASAAGVRIVPILVDGATMPKESELPESLGYFARLQAQTVHDDSWEHDVAVLSRKLAGA